ncbi:UNVERIFIED_CONTAM: hypothetical protein Sangu_2396300 [Sesamum angustifolium]|uniref:Uncharacterized protein n=1 Tax=Sesamum angustifolium TaxID=2727405 RepID=A0AAW2KXR0_9LAMI
MYFPSYCSSSSTSSSVFSGALHPVGAWLHTLSSCGHPLFSCPVAAILAAHSVPSAANRNTRALLGLRQAITFRPVAPSRHTVSHSSDAPVCNVRLIYQLRISNSISIVNNSSTSFRIIIKPHTPLDYWNTHLLIERQT